MTLRIDLVGRKFGRLTVVAAAKSSALGQAKWLCLCDCGNLHHTTGNNLRSGRTKSCGCIVRENLAPKHGLCHTPTYGIWLNMRNRCKNPKATGYDNYGGRGISVCARWDSFENFLADMGERPEALTLDRINNSGNYEPSNCRWATRSMQTKNSRHRNGSKTHCIRGHEFTPENTYINCRGNRHCGQCERQFRGAKRPPVVEAVRAMWKATER